MVMTQTTVKTATGQTIGLGLGNACAWMLLEWLKFKYQYAPADPVTTVVMAGTVFGGLFLQFRRIGAGIKYVFDRFVPVKHDHPEE